MKMHRAVALLALLALAAVAAHAGAGRTRPGGGRSGGSAPQQAAGRASYAHGGHYGYGHGHHHGYGYPYYGHYGFYGYLGWPWGGWYGGAPYYVIREVLVDPEGPGAVETDVKPKKATVIVDGAVLGQARDYNGRWELLWLEPGPHLIEFSRDGYMTLRRHLEVRTGMHLRIVEDLQRGEGIDPRSSSGPAPSTPDTAQRGVTGDPPEQSLATAIEAPSSSGTLQRGMLRLTVEPADAAVYLDGEFLARAGELNRLHGALPVARGIHTVEVVRPGYRSRAVEVDVTGDGVERVEIRLDRSR